MLESLSSKDALVADKTAHTSLLHDAIGSDKTGVEANNNRGAAATREQVAAGNLPPLQLIHAENAPIHSNQSNSQWSAVAGAWAIGKDLVKGAYNEVTEHPVHLLESAAVGAVIGVATVVAAPELAIVAGVAGCRLRRI